MDDVIQQRQRSIFAAMEKTPCLIGMEMINEGKHIDDAIVQSACAHSIAISLRRIADTLELMYEHGIGPER